MNNENSELWEAMKSAKYRDTLEELARMVNGAENLDEVLGIMINAIVNAVHAEAGTLWYYDKFSSGKIVPKAVYGGGEIGDFRLEFGEGLAGGVIKDCKHVLIKDCQQDERWAGKVDAKTGFITNSMICVPLVPKNAEHAFACVQIINKADGSLFDDEDMNFAVKLADEFARLYTEKAKSQIVGHDNLGGLEFDKALSQATEQAALAVLWEGLSKIASLKEREKIKIQRYFAKIYRVLK